MTHLRSRLAVCGLGLGLVVVAACTPVVGRQKGNGRSAAVFAASNVAAAVINRQITHECYAACTPGNTCNHETGFCDPIACACPADQICEQTGEGLVCRQPKRRPEDLDAGDDREVFGPPAP